MPDDAHLTSQVEKENEDRFFSFISDCSIIGVSVAPY